MRRISISSMIRRRSIKRRQREQGKAGGVEWRGKNGWGEEAGKEAERERKRRVEGGRGVSVEGGKRQVIERYSRVRCQKAGAAKCCVEVLLGQRSLDEGCHMRVASALKGSWRNNLC